LQQHPALEQWAGQAFGASAVEQLSLQALEGGAAPLVLRLLGGTAGQRAQRAQQAQQAQQAAAQQEAQQARQAAAQQEAQQARQAAAQQEAASGGEAAAAGDGRQGNSAALRKRVRALGRKEVRGACGMAQGSAISAVLLWCAAWLSTMPCFCHASPMPLLQCHAIVNGRLYIHLTSHPPTHPPAPP